MIHRWSVLVPAASIAMLGACAAPTSRPAAAPVPVPLGAQTITPTDVFARVSFLASDALLGRGTPSPGLEAAAAYLASEYMKMGLQPAGESGTFYQRYPFPLRQTDIAGTALSVSGPSLRRSLQLGKDYYVRGATAAQLQAPLVFTGSSVSTVPNAAQQLRDKVVVTALPGAFTRDFRILRDQQARAAEKEGADAIVQILDPSWTPDSVALFARAISEPRRALGEEIEFPQFLLTYTAARDVFTAAGLNLDALWTEAAAGNAVEPLELPGLTATASAPVRWLDRAYPANVVAVLPGSDPRLRNEYVVLSAHYDHVGVDEPVNGDSIYNGADDDASGNAALLEIAEAFASLPENARPKRSVVFLHVSGEEKGLLGSYWFSEHPTIPLDRVVANINIDMIGRNAPDTVVVIGKDYSTLGQVVNAVGARNPELGLTVADDIWPEERFFFRSDHFNFARKEVPALFFFTGVHEDYHKPSDEVDKLNVDKVARIARLVFYTIREVADTEGRPQWDPAGLEEVRRLTTGR